MVTLVGVGTTVRRFERDACMINTHVTILARISLSTPPPTHSTPPPPESRLSKIPEAEGADGSIAPMALGSVGWIMPGAKQNEMFYSYRYQTDKGGLYLPDKRYGIPVPHLQEVSKSPVRVTPVRSLRNKLIFFHHNHGKRVVPVSG